MSNLEQCLRDGYSTGRLRGRDWARSAAVDASDFYSRPGKGTADPGALEALAQRREARPCAGRMGAVNVRKPGEDVCGDAWGWCATETI